VTTDFGEAWDLLFHPPVAHRGLWRPDGAPENSLGAFQAACAAGYGVELDVHLSADGEAMVFHDNKLARMTGAEGRLRDRTAADLGALKLAGTDETIPTLREALVEIGHRAMVHIELKTPFGEVGPDRYPGVLRGLDSYSWDRAPHMAEDQRRAFAALEHVEIARPHFLALGLDMLPSARAAEMRAEGMPVIAWTVREPAQWERVKAGCDNLIFEGFAA
jgi:glycerophosphoryl diester phosphodiesterase